MMKFILSFIITLAVGILLGRSWGVKQTQALSEQAPARVSSQKSDTRTALTSQESKLAQIGRKIQAQGFNTNGVFGKLATQLERYQKLDDAGFEAEVANVQALPPNERRFAAQMLFSAWGEKNPVGALEFIKANTGPTGRSTHFKRTVYQAWAAQNPEALVEYFEADTDLSNKNHHARYDISAIVNEWSKYDDEAAFNWLKDFDSDLKSHAAGEFIENLANTDLIGAKSKLMELTGKSQETAAKKIAKKWGSSMDWETVQSELSSLSGAAHEIAQREALYAFTSASPYEATEIISDYEGTASEKYRLIRNVTSKIGTENPGPTLEWALSNLNETYQNSISRSVFDPWSKNAPNEAGEWLLTQPDDKISRIMLDQVLKSKNTSDVIKTRLENHFGSQ